MIADRKKYIAAKIEFEKEFEAEEFQMLVLVKAPCSGAVYFNDMLRPSVDFLASVDLQTGELSQEKGRLEWLAKKNDKRKGWGHNFKQFGIYRVVVRKCIPRELKPHQLKYMNNRYMLVRVIRKNAQNDELQVLKEYYSKPVSIENELGSFSLKREYSWFEGCVDWNGAKANVYLDTDKEDGDTAENAMAALKRLAEDLAENDAKFRKFAAENLTEAANDWLSEEDEAQEITKEDFAKRIKIGSATVSADGSLCLMYDDDDMFWGHIIEITVEPNGEPSDANIAG